MPPTDRLSRSLLVLRSAHAALCAASLGTAAIARNASCAPGCGSGALTPGQLRSSTVVSVGQHPRRRACCRVVHCKYVRPKRRTYLQTPIPWKGLRHAPRHNAQKIMRKCCTRLRRARTCPLSPHNMRYVEVHAQRAKTLAVESGEAPQISSPAHPLRGARSLTSVFASFSAAGARLPPKGAPTCSLRHRASPLAARVRTRSRTRAAPAPIAEDGACHGRCKSETRRAVHRCSCGSPVDEGRGSANPSSTGG
jgi:hypothetical protein